MVILGLRTSNELAILINGILRFTARIFRLLRQAGLQQTLRKVSLIATEPIILASFKGLTFLRLLETCFLHSESRDEIRTYAPTIQGFASFWPSTLRW